MATSLWDAVLAGDPGAPGYIGGAGSTMLRALAVAFFSLASISSVK